MGEETRISVENKIRQFSVYDQSGKLTSLTDRPAANQLAIAELRNSLGKSRTVKFNVQHVGYSPDSKLYFINSLTDHRDPKCFTVVVPEGAMDGFKELGIDDLNLDLINQMIRVTGKIVEYKGKLEIVVQDVAKEIRMVESEHNGSDENAIVVEPETE